MTKILQQSASDKLVQELTIATDASIGIIAIRCAETEVYRVVDELYALAQSQSVEFKMHTSETGWCSYAKVDPDDRRAAPFDALNPSNTDKSTADLVKAFQFLYSDSNEDDGFYVMLDTYFHFGEKAAQTLIRKQAHRALSNGQRLFLVVPNHADIPEGISPLTHIIEYGFPTREELSVSLDDVLESINEKERPKLTEEERTTILSNGQGMTSAAFETAVALSITDYSAKHEEEIEDNESGLKVLRGSLKGYGAEHIISMLRHYKMQLLKKTNILELQQEVSFEDIGGLDLFKDWMKQRSKTFTEEAKEFGITPSKGAMVLGAPGTGKSMLAKAAGSILGLPVIKFDVGKVFGSFIGQSEQAMRGALHMLDAMSPCVLMLDEVDKGFSGMTGGSNDSGTTSRVFGTFLTWMQERDQINRPIFLIMTANRIHGLPPELLRKGRVDEIWSVNLPNAVERAEIIKIHAAKRHQKIEKADMPSLVRITEGLVGAEIEALVEDALVISFSEGKAEITYETLEKAKEYLKPMSKTRETEFNEMKSWAENNARPASTEEDMHVVTKPSKQKAINSKRSRLRRLN